MHYLKNLLLLLSFSFFLFSCSDDDAGNPAPVSPYQNYLKIDNEFYELNSAQAFYDEDYPTLFTLWLLKDDDEQLISFDFLRSAEEADLSNGTYSFKQPVSGNASNFEQGKFYYVLAKANAETSINSGETQVVQGETKIKKLGEGNYEITYKVKFQNKTVEGYYKGEVEIMESW
ncbi:hypothetical protein [Rufibacter roseus]|uniref:Uncharacterized protein n=1 Tax=Rufibacter roseus TaxID=1567108 RepID=A0ABW2DI56_9BACT|nr:hypothetical protein [Rufibacter roseus]